MPKWNITSEGLANLADQVLGEGISETGGTLIKAEAYPPNFNGYISINYDQDDQVEVTHVAKDFVQNSPIDTGPRYSRAVDGVREMNPETLEAEIKEKIRDVYEFARNNS